MNEPGVPPSEDAADRLGVSLRPNSLRPDSGISGDSDSADANIWFADLVQVHTRRVFALLYRMTGNAGDAQDLSQEAFLKAWQNRRQLRDAARPTPWLLRIAANCAIDFQRSRASQHPGSPMMPSLDDEAQGLLRDGLASDNLTPESASLRSDRERRLWAAVEILSPKERAAIVMRDIEGCPNRDVAAALGCSMITVRTHIASARTKMRKFLVRTEKVRAEQKRGPGGNEKVTRK
jgi:RNA polymerase sigma-70 factor, ECF subfamily